jgi:hypothetical protein
MEALSSGIWLEGLRKPTIDIRISSVPSENPTEVLLDASLERYRYSNLRCVGCGVPMMTVKM